MIFALHNQKGGARIKVLTFTQGMTVADLLRALLEREFPENRP